MVWMTTGMTCVRISDPLRRATQTDAHTGPFLYPSFEWAYKKIERSIRQMGSAGTASPASGQD